jgi:hypothetical protein
MQPMEAIAMAVAARKDLQKPSLLAHISAAAERQYDMPTSYPKTALEAELFAGQRKLASIQGATPEARSEARMKLFFSDDQAGKFALQDEFQDMRRLQGLKGNRLSEITSNYPAAIAHNAVGMAGDEKARRTAVAFEDTLTAEGKKEEMAKWATPQSRADAKYEEAVGGLEWYQQLPVRFLHGIDIAGGYARGMANPQAYALSRMDTFEKGRVAYDEFQSGERKIEGTEELEVLKRIEQLLARQETNQKNNHQDNRSDRRGASATATVKER